MPRTTVTDAALLAAWAASGGRVLATAKALGVSQPLVRKRLLALGEQLRGVGCPKGSVTRRSSPHRRQLADLVEEHGGRLTPIGDALGLTAERARQLISEMGLFERAEQLRDLRRVAEAAVKEAAFEETVHVGVCVHCGRTFRTTMVRITCSAECSKERKMAITRRRVAELYHAKRAGLPRPPPQSMVAT